MANDPIQTVLQGVSKLRSQVHAQLINLPGPNPARQTLQDVDQRMTKLESDIRAKLPKLPGS